MIPIIIPAYEPDENLVLLLKKLVMDIEEPIIVVDDGSGEEYSSVFFEAEKIIKEHDGVLLRHDNNRGKGRALKTAFEYVINNYKDSIGSVTADSDGQHSPQCIKSIIDTLYNNKDKLILGVRNFDGEDVPWKSRFGNKLTEKVFEYVSGIHVTDTQTGLRGIPLFFMKKLLDVKGERFEFETEMLLESYGICNILEISIETIYDSKEDHQTHFNPILDSLKIYKILGKRFFKFIFSSLSSSVVDLVLFSILCYLFKERFHSYVAVSTVIARMISATYNYIINYKVVFRSNASVSSSGIKYIVLAITQMSLSAIIVTIGVKALSFVPEVIVKIIVDTILFFISYKIQQNHIFKGSNSKIAE